MDNNVQKSLQLLYVVYNIVSALYLPIPIPIKNADTADTRYRYFSTALIFTISLPPKLILAYLSIQTHAHIHAHTHMHTRTYTRTHTHTCTYIQTYTHIYAHTHIRSHTHTHTHTIRLIRNERLLDNFSRFFHLAITILLSRIF